MPSKLSSTNSKKTSVVRNAAFLMAATLICRVIGLLYRSPLHNIIGNLGDGYYSYAFEWYNIILLVSSYSIPMAVSKVMAERIAVGRYKSTYKIFKTSLIYVLIVGTAGALLAYFGAPLMLSGQENAILALRVLAPTILLSGILGVFRGYFQAHNSMTQTAFSQVMEQIVNAIISVLAAWAFTRPFVGNMAKTGEYGAAGGTLGTGVGVATALIIMVILFFQRTPVRNKLLYNDPDEREETFGSAFGIIFAMVTPVILATCVYNVSGVIDQRIFTSLMLLKGVDDQEISVQYGLFGYQVKPLLNIPIALASATSTALIPSIATHIAKRDKKTAIARIDESVKFTMVLAIPCSIGLCILSYPIIRILYPSIDAFSAALLLSLGAVSIIFYCLSTVTNGVLQGLGKPSVPVRNSALALMVNVIFVIVSVSIWDIDIVGVLFSTVAYAVTASLLNSLSIRNRIKYRADFKSTYLLPLAAAAVMGVVVGAVFWVPFILFRSVLDNRIMIAALTFVSVILGMVVYVIAYARFSRKNEAELRAMPAGKYIVKFLKVLHILK